MMFRSFFLLCVLLGLLTVNPPLSAGPVKGKKIALLVGVNKTQSKEMAPLRFCSRDVQELAKSLKEIGFQTIVLTDGGDPKHLPTKANINEAIKDIAKGESAPEDQIVFAFSGQGFSTKNAQYLIPADASKLSDPSGLVRLEDLIKTLENRKGLKFFILDSCRNPQEDLDLKEGSVLLRLPTDFILLQSCSDGQMSFESVKHQHGFLFYHLLQNIRLTKDGGKSIEVFQLGSKVMSSLREDQEQKEYKQKPEMLANLSGNFVFIEAPSRPSVKFPPGTPPTTPAGQQSEPSPASPQPAPAPNEPRVAPTPLLNSNLLIYLDKDKKIPLELIKIEPKKDDDGGEFLLMGPKNLQSKEGFENTDTQYEVPSSIRMSKAYWIAKYPVTVKQFRAYLDATNKDGAELRGEHVKGWSDEGLAQKNYGWDKIGFKQEDEYPVVGITRENARDFLKWVQKRYERQTDNSDDRRVFRLPTEAEWEYACRAGKKTAYFFGNDINDLAKYGNFLDPGSKKNDGFPTDKPYLGKPDGYAQTSPVGKFLPNGFGLFDMHGNVWQMCEDGFINQAFEEGETDPVRLGEYAMFVAKGGSWLTRADDCRCASREEYDPNQGYAHIGFRPCFGVKLDDSEGGGGAQQNRFIWKQLNWPVENGGDGKLYWWKCNPITGVNFDGPFVDQNGNRPIAPQPAVGGGGALAKQKQLWQKDDGGKWWIVDPETKKNLEGPFNQGPAMAQPGPGSASSGGPPRPAPAREPQLNPFGQKAIWKQDQSGKWWLLAGPFAQPPQGSQISPGVMEVPISPDARNPAAPQTAPIGK